MSEPKFKPGDIIFCNKGHIDIMRVLDYISDGGGKYRVEQINLCDDYEPGELSRFSQRFVEINYVLLTEENKAQIL
jgi:hypothetical protein